MHSNTPRRTAPLRNEDPLQRYPAIQFPSEQKPERDVVVIPRSDGGSALEISSIPHHTAEGWGEPLTRLTKSDPQSRTTRGLIFGTGKEPDAMTLAAIDLARDAHGAFVADAGEARMEASSGPRVARFELFPDRAEANVPMRFAVIPYAPRYPAEGWVYFDTSRQALRIFARGDWHDLATVDPAEAREDLDFLPY